MREARRRRVATSAKEVKAAAAEAIASDAREYHMQGAFAATGSHLVARCVTT